MTLFDGCYLAWDGTKVINEKSKNFDDFCARTNSMKCLTSKHNQMIEFNIDCCLTTFKARFYVRVFVKFKV